MPLFESVARSSSDQVKSAVTEAAKVPSPATKFKGLFGQTVASLSSPPRAPQQQRAKPAKAKVASSSPAAKFKAFGQPVTGSAVGARAAPAGASVPAKKPKSKWGDPMAKKSAGQAAEEKAKRAKLEAEKQRIRDQRKADEVKQAAKDKVAELRDAAAAKMAADAAQVAAAKKAADHERMVQDLHKMEAAEENMQTTFAKKAADGYRVGGGRYSDPNRDAGDALAQVIATRLYGKAWHQGAAAHAAKAADAENTKPEADEADTGTKPGKRVSFSDEAGKVRQMQGGLFLLSVLTDTTTIPHHHRRRRRRHTHHHHNRTCAVAI